MRRYYRIHISERQDEENRIRRETRRRLGTEKKKIRPLGESVVFMYKKPSIGDTEIGAQRTDRESCAHSSCYGA